MDYWIFVNYTTEKRKNRIDKAIKILQDMDFNMPVLDSNNRIIALLTESRHTDIDLNNEIKVNIESEIMKSELSKIKTVKNIFNNIGFDTSLTTIERENKIKFNLEIVEDKMNSGIKWNKIQNKTTKATN